jgi:Secretion system C-terminal sorting domain
MAPFTAGIYSISGAIDTNLSNNTFTTFNTICTSYDPNDKSVFPSGALAQGFLPASSNEPLSYQVRFQNTGTAPAANVIIADTLDSDLDISTLQIIGTSHAMVLDIVGNNILKFKFLGIILPDSTTDEPGSHGYVRYSIKRKAGTSPTAQINNTAHIYFDYNPAVVTNTVTNTYYEEPVVVSTSTIGNTLCNQTCGNGSVVVNAINGVAPYSYEVNPKCATTTVIGNAINNLLQGNYTIVGKDAIGNSFTEYISIAPPDPILVMTANTVPSGASITYAGGTAPTNVTWQPGNFTGTSINAVPAGTYTYTVTDAGTCSASGILQITAATSINGNAHQAIKVYPNPTQNKLYIDGTETMQGLTITDVMGKVIYRNTLNANSITIDVQQWARGAYFVKGKGFNVKVVLE